MFTDKPCIRIYICIFPIPFLVPVSYHKGKNYSLDMQWSALNRARTRFHAIIPLLFLLPGGGGSATRKRSKHMPLSSWITRPPMVNCAKIGPRKDETRAEAVKRKPSSVTVHNIVGYYVSSRSCSSNSRTSIETGR